MNEKHIKIVMRGVAETPRYVRAWLPIVLLAMLFVVSLAPQGFAERPAPAKAQQGAAQAMQDATPQPASTQTPEEIRQDQIKADTMKLFQLSAELRAEVAKTYKETLSISVLRKAEEIEKLAKSLKALMNQEAAARR